MRVLAASGTGDEVEASVERDGEDHIVVKIGEASYRLQVFVGEGGRLEVQDDQGRTHVVEVVGTDLRVDGLAFPFQVRKAPPKVEGAMRGGGGAAGMTTVKPPMPGKIAKVLVSPGDAVQPGDVLVILEAMKMQNEIVSPVEGTVKGIEVKVGDSIDSKRVICTIE